jgi:hypothetical protein
VLPDLPKLRRQRVLTFTQRFQNSLALLLARPRAMFGVADQRLGPHQAEEAQRYGCQYQAGQDGER